MREVEARLKISAIDRTGAVFKSVADKMRRVADQASEFNRRNAQSTRRQVEDFDRINGLYTKALAAVSTGYVAKEAYSDFAGRERMLTRIAITAGATDEELQDARDTVARLSKEFAAAPEKVVESLDTLIASGKTIKDSLGFLPDIVKTAQAANTEYADMAKTAGTLSGALDITKEKMREAFDVMLTQGKAGAFEMKDMASELPAVGAAYSSLGDKGVAGMIRLNAMLQTLREGTATSSDAATQAINIFGKVNSQETRNKFKKMGVDLEKEMIDATKRGTAPIEAFTEITRKALKGNMNNLSLLFEDTQVRLGMTTLLDKPDSYKKYLAAGRDPGAIGAVDRDLKRILQDAQTPIDRMKASLDRAVQTVGKAVEKPVTAVLDRVSEDTDKESAALRGFQMQGHTGGWAWWKMLNNMPIGPVAGSDAYERAAREGGYVPADRDDLKRIQKQVPFAYNVLGRLPNRPASHPWEQGRRDEAYQSRLDDFQRMEMQAFADMQKADKEMRDRPPVRDGDQPRRFSLIKAMQVDTGKYVDKRDETGKMLGDLSELTTGFEKGADAGGQKIAESGEAFMRSVQQAATALTAAAQQVAAKLANVSVNVNSGSAAPRVNADTGKSNGFVKGPVGMGAK